MEAIRVRGRPVPTRSPAGQDCSRYSRRPRADCYAGFAKTIEGFRQILGDRVRVTTFDIPSFQDEHKLPLA